MPSDTLGLIDLLEISDLLLASGKVRLRIASASMAPALNPGDEIVVEPVPIKTLRAGDVILFEHKRQLICHRLVELSEHGTLLARGDAAGSGGQRISTNQVLGKVVSIRRRTLWVGLEAALGSALLPLLVLLVRWLRYLQRLRIYRHLLRPLVAAYCTYHLGLAQGSRWYCWRELEKRNGSCLLVPSTRPHLLLAKRGKDVAGSVELIWVNSAWRWQEPEVRVRYRGLGLEKDLARVAHQLVACSHPRVLSNGPGCHRA